jgi:hypothetical protein
MHAWATAWGPVVARAWVPRPAVVVPQDGRAVVVRFEARTAIVPAPPTAGRVDESRVVTVPAETRVARVPADTEG